MIDDTAVLAHVASMLGIAASSSLFDAPGLRVVEHHEEPVPLAETGYRAIRNEPAAGVIHVIGNIEG